MNVTAHVYDRSLVEPAPAGSSVMIPVFLSMLLHAAVIAALIIAPLPSGGNRLPPGALSVRLVSLPGPGGGSGPAPTPEAKPVAEPITEKPAQIQKLPTVPLPEPEPEAVRQPPPPAEEPPAVVSVAPPQETVKPKVSLKKETKDANKIIEDAIRRIEKGVKQPKSEQRSVDAAIERLKKQVAESEARKLQPYQPQSVAGEGGGGGGAVGGGGGGAIRLVDIYRVEIASQIEKNWAFPRQLAGNASGLETRLEFKVMPDGEIADIRFDARSNNASLDESAYKAIVKSNPVAPHPPGISLPFVMVGIRFTPEGLN